jgi:hypothetical protein
MLLRTAMSLGDRAFISNALNKPQGFVIPTTLFMMEKRDAHAGQISQSPQASPSPAICTDADLPTTNGVTCFSTPRIRLDVALHRRGNDWIVVYPRAYGMAQGNRFFGQISSPEEPLAPAARSNATHDPPSSHPNLNPRFWLRNGRDFADGYGNVMLEAEDLLRAEPPIFRDSGLERTRNIVITKGGSATRISERLVEVLVKEEGLCHRCATCGQWEDCYAESTRHESVGYDGGGRPIYWCGVKLRNSHCKMSLKTDARRIARGPQEDGICIGGMSRRIFRWTCTSIIAWNM